jgi:hypothetical protein
MSIDTKIEEEEENLVETSDGGFASDETYMMSPAPPSKNSTEDNV